MAINPLQLPAYAAPQQADFSSLAKLPEIYKKAQADQVRQQTLAELGQSGQVDPMRLIQSGDMTLANLGIGILNKQKEQERQDARYAITDARADKELAQTAAYRNRSLGLQEAQLREKPSIQKVKDAAGNESLVQVYPDGRTRALSPGEVASAGGGAGPNNPFAPDGKQTEGQANAGLYAGRMFQAEKILRDPKIEAAAQSKFERGKAMLPGTGKLYNLNSNDYQKFDQAQRNFINAVLRRESGAVISDQEFENARQQYFPAPDDTPDRIAQKRANRAEAIRGIAGAAGPAWKAPATFDAEGNMQDRGAKQPAAATSGPKPGSLEDGYRFKGGDPADPKNWVKAQ